MAPAAPTPMDPLPAKRDAGIRHSWRVWLVVGLCFGLGYGLTQRFTALQRSEGGSIQQRFRDKPPPGTRLDDLRRRSGDDDADLQPDLDRLARDREEQEEKRKELEERRRELEERESARRDEEEEDWEDFPEEPESPPSESRRRVTEPEPEPVRRPTFDRPRADSLPLPDRIEPPPARSFPEPPPLPAPRPAAPPPPLP